MAKSEAFVNLAHELCLQIAAARPLFVKASDVAEDFLASERKIYQKQFEESGKPQDIMNKIIQGKLDKYQQEVSLLSQPWVKDPSKNMQGLLEEVRAKTGENIEVVKFARFEI